MCSVKGFFKKVIDRGRYLAHIYYLSNLLSLIRLSDQISLRCLLMGGSNNRGK